MNLELKKNLLRAVRMINKADGDTIEIIRRNSMLHTKLIERSAKHTKDPNPLASTIVTMSQKYPLAIDAERARKYGVPEEFIHKIGNADVEDTHVFGRVLAKKEAVDWWIEKSAIPDEDIISTIDILYKQQRKNVTDFFDMKWTESRIVFGEPLLTRKEVPTQMPFFEVDKLNKESLILQTFFPMYVVPTTTITKKMMDEFKGAMGIYIGKNMTLQSQIRIIMNALDRRTRVLPIPSGASIEASTVQHAVRGNNFVIVDYSAPKSSRINSKNPEPIKNFFKCLIFEARMSSLNENDLRNIVQETTINMETVETALDMNEGYLTNEKAWFTSLRKISARPEFMYGRLKLCVHDTTSIVEMQYNLSGVPFRKLIGDVTMNFEHGDMRGSFTYNGGMLQMITTNYTTMNDLRKLLSIIGEYTKFLAAGTKGRTLEAMNREIRKNIYDEPHSFIYCTKEEWEIQEREEKDELIIFSPIFF